MSRSILKLGFWFGGLLAEGVQPPRAAVGAGVHVVARHHVGVAVVALVGRALQLRRRRAVRAVVAVVVVPAVYIACGC